MRNLRDTEPRTATRAALAPGLGSEPFQLDC
jgi:hypothetical protein